MRAGIVNKLQDYHWSSARIHILGTEDPLVELRDLKEFGEINKYRSYIANTETEKDIGIIRKMTRKGLPIGNFEFQQVIESRTNRKLIPRKVGRPPKIET